MEPQNTNRNTTFPQQKTFVHHPKINTMSTKNIFIVLTGLTPVNVIQETTYTDDAGTVHILFVHDNPEESEAKNGTLFVCSHEDTAMRAGAGSTPEEAEKDAVSNFKKADKVGLLGSIIGKSKYDRKRAERKAKETQERAEQKESMDEDTQEAVKNYAASIKDRGESDDHAEPYAQLAHETITKDNIKRVLINADDLPDHAAELLADIVVALIKNQQIELQEKTVSQYYAPVRTVGYCDHGEQEDQIEFAELEKLGVPDTPAARRMVGRIFSDEGFTVNDTGGKYFHAYHITGNATALLLPYLNTIFSVMQNQETP